MRTSLPKSDPADNVYSQTALQRGFNRKCNDYFLFGKVLKNLFWSV